MSRSLHPLRARIAMALGLGVLVPLTNAPEPAAATTTSDPTEEYCRPPDTSTEDTGQAPVGSGAGGTGVAASCAPAGFVAAEAVGQEPSDGGCAITEVIGEGVYDPYKGACCYPVTTSCGTETGYAYDKFDCGCYGRPLVVADAVIAAAPTPRRDWRDALRPDVAGLRPDQRERLAAYWLDNARAEHSSVAGFARLVLDLLAAGAPAALVDRAQVAGADELRHARACYGLASAYAGRDLGPGGLASAPIPLDGDVVALAVSTARDGCVGETIAASFAGALAERATDPAVRETLAAIAEEEAAHAELSWAILAWCLDVGGDAVRDAVRAVFAAPASIPADGTPDEPALVAHGLVSDADRRRICQEAADDVVGALAQALLQRRAA